jgi:NAD(P)-dependent dehydrogenase (short-subunit alcohol dehydrogenase family)
MSQTKNVLIVGGNSGIGAEVLDRFLALGYNVHLALRKHEEVSKPVASKQFYDALLGNESELEMPEVLDAVVYCPGTIQLKPFNRIDSEQMRNDMEVNAFGAARIIQAAIRSLKKSEAAGGASVVMFSSVAAQTGLAFHASISMAKAAVEGLTISLASELAPAGIRVNAIAPSLTDTPLASMLLNSDAKREASAGRHPLKTVGTPSGVASLVNYLISDDAAFVTGQIFKVDGGMSSLR